MMVLTSDSLTSPQLVCSFCFVYSQGPQHPEFSTAYVDQRALRVDRVVVLERGAPHSVCLMESGKILPGVNVMVVHPDTKVPCAHTDLGEVRDRVQREL